MMLWRDVVDIRIENGLVAKSEDSIRSYANTHGFTKEEMTTLVMKRRKPGGGKKDRNPGTACVRWQFKWVTMPLLGG